MEPPSAPPLPDLEPPKPEEKHQGPEEGELPDAPPAEGKGGGEEGEAPAGGWHGRLWLWLCAAGVRVGSSPQRVACGGGCGTRAHRGQSSRDGLANRELCVRVPA